MAEASEGIAKISWDDPVTGELRDYVLTEGATVQIGRNPDNDVSIPERHVSRHHAVISYRHGLFLISDLGSANGVFVNDQKITDPFPLAHGDVIRLFVPTMRYSAVVTAEEEEAAIKTGTLIRPRLGGGRPIIQITSGAQEGLEIPVIKEEMTFGRATSSANWDIILQDQAVSRPHARLHLKDNVWYLTDLNSANGTLVNGNPIQDSKTLQDGSVIVMGETTMLFRLIDKD